MAVQGGNHFDGISSMLIDRMSDIRDTYQVEKKKRLEKEKTASPDYRYSFKSGQIDYHTNKEK